MQLSKRLGSCLLALFVSFTMMYQPAQGHRSQPQEIYHRAWQLVKDNYYDANFNNQNWVAWEHKYDSQIRNSSDAHAAIKRMLESLSDPYTRFLDPRAFQDENDAIDARIVGIGINLQQSKDNTKLIVTRTIENSPAEIAGIRAGDEIVAIDGASAIGLTPEQAAEKIRGQLGTPVKIAVKHKEQVLAFNIVRAEITIHAVSYKIMQPNIGYIQLSTFISNDASKEFRTALQKLSTTDGLIVDLRDNPGGLLSNALEIADMLLEDGAIVSTIGRHGKHTDVASGEPLTHQPLVVLVDEDSASASEILAGALKDNSRGVVIGTRTYGKGLVQEINRLPGGAAIHITVSKYYTPNGSDINKVGVAPDIQIKDKDEQVKMAVDYLKEKIAQLHNPAPSGNLSFVP
jgi:carboxyl-terminal processing protease